MERAQRLVECWNWLPAFRAVAELEHLTLAAESVRISPSALSRSVHLLEEQLGMALFRRQGRRLTLTHQGQQLLASVRQAMRLLDESLDSARAPVGGPLRLAAPSAYATAYLLDALVRLRGEYPGLVVELVPLPEDPAEQLLAGDIDVAVLEAPVPHADLLIEPLATLAYGVYCGPGHPLYAQPPTDLQALLSHAFVAPSRGVRASWPAHHPRQIAYRVSQLQQELELCGRGACLAVLPAVLAAAWPVPGGLRSLPFEPMPSGTLSAVIRAPVSELNNATVTMAALKEALAGAAQAPG